jgi:DNA-binding transcriptional LysR family regulator
MDLFDGLVPFVAAADAKSFRAAARGLGVTVSAVSKSIARLEAEVGVALLHRTSRSVTLTAEGEEFLRSCRGAVDTIRSAREQLAHSQRAPVGVLRASLPSTFGRRLMAALPAWLARNPSLSVQILQTDRFVQLADENIDVAVRIGDVEASRDIVRRLGTTELATIAAPRYLARHGRPSAPDELAQHNCLRFLSSKGLAHPWSFAGPDGVSPRRVSGNFTADHGEALLAALAQGLGIGQAPRVMVADELARGELVEVLSEYAAPGPPISILSAHGRHRLPKVREFAEIVAATCEPLLERPPRKPGSTRREPPSRRTRTR